MGVSSLSGRNFIRKPFRVEQGRLTEPMICCWGEGVRLPILTVFVMSATPAFPVEFSWYQGAAKDGGTLEYVFEAGEQNSPNAVTKEKVAEIAADFMTTFYHVQVGALVTQEFRTQPVPFWLVCFSDAVKGPLHEMYFVVLLPDGTVVVPSVEKRCRHHLQPINRQKSGPQPITLRSDDP
jgi:hypothetical protein